MSNIFQWVSNTFFYEMISYWSFLPSIPFFFIFKDSNAKFHLLIILCRTSFLLIVEVWNVGEIIVYCNFGRQGKKRTDESVKENN